MENTVKTSSDVPWKPRSMNENKAHTLDYNYFYLRKQITTVQRKISISSTCFKRAIIKSQANEFEAEILKKAWFTIFYNTQIHF